MENHGEYKMRISTTMHVNCELLGFAKKQFLEFLDPWFYYIITNT
jgi:hypothetical protein